MLPPLPSKVVIYSNLLLVIYYCPASGHIIVVFENIKGERDGVANIHEDAKVDYKAITEEEHAAEEQVKEGYESEEEEDQQNVTINQSGDCRYRGGTKRPSRG